MDNYAVPILITLLLVVTIQSSGNIDLQYNHSSSSRSQLKGYVINSSNSMAMFNIYNTKNQKLVRQILVEPNHKRKVILKPGTYHINVRKNGDTVGDEIITVDYNKSYRFRNTYWYVEFMKKYELNRG